MVRNDVALGHENLHHNYRELNNRSPIDYTDEMERDFNMYRPPRSDDPDDSWRANTVRPVVRNKIISIVAHITSSIMVPTTHAQNSNDERDKISGQVMKDMIKWVVQNSNYERSYLQSVINMCVAPGALFEVQYVEAKKKTKLPDETKEGKPWVEKEVIDDVHSGFQFSPVPVTDIYIANPYEGDIQKQRFLARTKRLDYNEAKAIYGDNENFKHVQPGMHQVFDQDSYSFYSQEDHEYEGMVEEVTYWNRGMDLELCFVGGVLMSDPDRPIKRLDKRYPIAKSGGEPFTTHDFFYRKSVADKLSHDKELVDTLYNMVLDGTFLSLMPPMANYGDEELDSSVFVPGSIAQLDADSKLESLAPRSDLNSGMSAIQMIEQSMGESSLSSNLQGVSSEGSQTAKEVSLLQKNAMTNLGWLGKMNKQLVEDVGKLVISDIQQHLTVGDAFDTVSPYFRLKYRSFLLSNENVDGKNVTKKITFDSSYQNKETEKKKDKEKNEMNLLEKEGWDTDTRLYCVNPEKFRNLSFLVSVDADDMADESESMKRAISLEGYDRMIQNPHLDGEAVTREMLVDVYKPGEADKFMKGEKKAKQEQMQLSLIHI